MDLTHGINPNQEVEGMVSDYNKREAQEAGVTEDTPKEHMEVNQEAVKMVTKGRLDPRNGLEIAPTSKAKAAEINQFKTPSDDYLDNYDSIRWDT